MSSPIVECTNVRKVYRTAKRAVGLSGLWRSFVAREHVEFTALAGIDLSILPGEFVGLIGPNGAGKTTLVKALVGIVPVTSGSAKLFGVDSFHLADVDKARLSLVMGQRSQLWWDIPAIDSFHLLREIYRVDRARFDARVREMSQRLEVEGQLTVQLRSLSLGTRMKMEIIGAFLHEPAIVFLDEPTIGLDLVSRDTIRQFLVEVNRDSGAAVVLTSHDVEDIERTCRRLVILESGRVLYDGDLVGLQRRLVGKRAVQVHLEPDSPRVEVATLALGAFDAEVLVDEPFALTFVVPAEKTREFLRHLLDRLPVRDVNVERQPLEGLIKEIFQRRSMEDGAAEVANAARSTGGPAHSETAPTSEGGASP